MTPSDLFEQIWEIKKFVSQTHKDAMGIKGIALDKHTYLISKAGCSFPDGIIKHDRGTCSVYFSGKDYFSLDITYKGYSFKANVHGERISFDNLSIENYITEEKGFKAIWELAKSVSLMSIAEKEVQNLKAEISANNRKNKDLRARIKELEAEYKLNG